MREYHTNRSCRDDHTRMETERRQSHQFRNALYFSACKFQFATHSRCRREKERSTTSCGFNLNQVDDTRESLNSFLMFFANNKVIVGSTAEKQISVYFHSFFASIRRRRKRSIRESWISCALWRMSETKFNRNEMINVILCLHISPVYRFVRPLALSSHFVSRQVV